ncbi:MULTISPECIES: FAD-dependent oxidoreductase [Streptacidiphilus]|uniref:FAD-dependent oxidoreductase n=1 Tax=Streptacidiphilus cavernicola TaxID=3342716 RepID=A0ABV6UX86_9ACTN|nr:FAD-dependent oxidoreductase [Streptacidiphilus jeojiense]
MTAGAGRPAVIVVGAGIIGAATAQQLTARGAATVIVDRADAPARGATGSSGGMVRAFDPDPTVAALASASLRIYADGSQWADGSSPLRRVGAVTIADSAAAPVLRAAARRLGLGAAAVSSAEELLGVRTAGGVGLVEPDAGWIDPVRATRDWLGRACRAGATARFGHAVVRVTTEQGRPGVELDDGTALTADAVVLALGAWAAQPVPGLREPTVLRTRSIQISTVRRGQEAGRAGHASFVDLRTGAYGRPIDEESSLIGLPHEVWDVDPADRHRPSVPHTTRTREAVAVNLPWAGQAPLLTTVRSYDGYTSSTEVLRPTGNSGVWSVRGWSGGGVKVAPAVGRLVAERVLSQVRTPS